MQLSVYKNITLSSHLSMFFKVFSLHHKYSFIYSVLLFHKVITVQYSQIPNSLNVYSYFNLSLQVSPEVIRLNENVLMKVVTPARVINSNTLKLYL